MKKVLILWLWFQWKKYVNYFLNNWFLVDWVTKSWLNKNNMLNLNKIFSFDKIKKQHSIFYQYDVIVIAIKPYKEQTNVIEFILSIGVKNKLIIEKPVTNNLSLLHKLIDKDNIYFFIDELILWKSYNKIINKNSDLSLIIYDKTDSDNISEHAISPFFLSDKFIFINKKIKTFFWTKKWVSALNYKIIIDNKYIIHCNSWNFYLNNIKIYSLNFWKSLEFILNINLIDNKTMKTNYYFYRKNNNNI